MKSNQERSNECLPPKKREILSSTLQTDRRSSPTMAPPSDAPRSDNMPWLESSLGVHRSHSQSEYKPLPSSTHSSPSSSSVRPVSSLPTLYTSPQNTGGTVHYTQLPPNLQFIASPYPTSYSSYIPSQIFTPPLPPPPQRSSHSETAPSKQERLSSDRTSMPPPPTDSVLSHHIQRTASLSHHHPPHSLHSQHALGHGMTQVMVQYPDGASRKEEGSSRSRELHNGELERGRRFGAESKPGSKLRDYEVRQLVMSSDYTTHDPLRTRTSVLLNSHSDHQLARASPEKHSSQGSIVSGKPVRTPSSSNTASSFTFPPPPSVESLKTAIATVSPQTVIQTTHNSTNTNYTDALSLGLPYTQQQPIIGYIAGTQHTPISYTSLPQHLLIPGAQQVIIPVSSGVTALETVTSHVTSSTQATAFPTTYIAATPPKGDTLDASLYHQGVPVVPGQLHLPVVPASPGLVASSSSAPPLSTSNTTVPHALPPYFIKGSIIQLADGELKRVEDLKTEDFIQSAEISSELKIDSSTVERIEGSHTSPNFAVVQFSVGEHRAQVSVEVLVEYPFFVFGQGWSSCCPDRTTQLLELPCTKLSVGDVCISLTLKNVRNGSLKKPIELSNTPLLKPPTRASSQDAPQTSRQHREKENGINQRGSSGSGSGTGGNVENGEVPFGYRPAQVAEVSSRRQSGGRKRRWSAPEGRKVERLEEEPPVTLPKPSFIPHEVKVSIEGRSNIGK